MKTYIISFTLTQRGEFLRGVTEILSMGLREGESITNYKIEEVTPK